MISQEILITNKTGLHARPATVFCKEASKFKSVITIDFKEKKLNAKSLISILGGGVCKGSKIILAADGEDEQQAMEVLGRYLINLKE